MIAFRSSGVRPGFSSTSTPRWRNIAAARGSILSAIRTLSGSATGHLPSPVEPWCERLDVCGVDGRSTPDTQPRRRIAIRRDVVGSVLAFQQLPNRLLPRAVGVVVRAVGKLQADRSIGPDRGIACQMLDPVSALHPMVERSAIGVGAGDQSLETTNPLGPVERE